MPSTHLAKALLAVAAAFPIESVYILASSSPLAELFLSPHLSPHSTCVPCDCLCILLNVNLFSSPRPLPSFHPARASGAEQIKHKFPGDTGGSGHDTCESPFLTLPATAIFLPILPDSSRGAPTLVIGVMIKAPMSTLLKHVPSLLWEHPLQSCHNQAMGQGDTFLEINELRPKGAK